MLQTTGEEFPEDPEEQLFGAICAVFKSWNNSRAVAYRELHSYSHNLGTAVNVQAMVFGNRGESSATGVVFTRNPSTGEPGLFGEFLQQAQGEDVVAGIRTPMPIRQAPNSLEILMPSVYQKLLNISQKLEKHFREIQDIEFTVEGGQLWILQTRKAKRSIRASLRAAVDFVNEGLMTEEEALMSLKPKDFEQLLHPTLDPKAKKKYLCKGLPASPGGAVGRIVFSPQTAVLQGKEKVILVRNETSPEDIKGMMAAQGILTTRGGMTSHAAVVARGLGKCCIVGCHSLSINEEKKECRLGDLRLKEGDIITLDGAEGTVYLGEISLVQPELDSYFYRFMEICRRRSQIKIKANADTPSDARTAKNFGASGIGLCRTEHMFFQEDRIDIVRKLILFQDNEEKKNLLLKELLQKQKQDFVDIFSVMEGMPICIRLLDPPLHEFLPADHKEIKAMAKKWSEDLNTLIGKTSLLKEENPMLGHRGCRLAVTFPELYETQTQAVAEAAALMLKDNKKCQPEIMIPLVGTKEEFMYVRNRIEKVIQEISAKTKTSLSIPIGTMIEIPQSALRADELAEEADFFSFGSNDLTQTTLGISRDDCSHFLPAYLENSILKCDPFVQLEEKSVGRLIAMAAEKARSIRKDFPLSLCGEHGADQKSISFLIHIVDAVSCSPYRIPSACLAAAQALIQENSLQKKGVL